jgi:hypothetical protein
MAMVGVMHSAHFFGNSNGTLTTSTTHKFAPSSIWAHPVLQSFDEDGFGTGVITSFVDNTGFHDVSNQIGGGDFVRFRDKCTQVHYFFIATDSIHGGSAITIFFG